VGLGERLGVVWVVCMCVVCGRAFSF